MVPLDDSLGELAMPNVCALIGHSRAGSMVADAASYINRQASLENVDVWLNPGYISGQPRLGAAAAVSYSSPPGQVPEPLAGDFQWWMAISGSNDGDTEAGQGVDVFDRISSLANAFAYPYWQTNVWVRGMPHTHFFDDGAGEGPTCDLSVVPNPETELEKADGNRIVRTCCTAFLLTATGLDRRFTPLFEINNLVSSAASDALGEATEILWRFPIVPFRFFDPNWGADGYEIAAGMTSDTGLLVDLALPEAETYRIPHVQTRGILVGWSAETPTPEIRFPLQVPNTVEGKNFGELFETPTALILQINAAVPPDGAPVGDSLTFRVGAGTPDGTPFWVDLASYGGLRPPAEVATTGGDPDFPTATAAVLKTISIPLRDFANSDAMLAPVDRIVLDFSTSGGGGRIIIGSIYVMGVIGAVGP